MTIGLGLNELGAVQLALPPLYLYRALGKIYRPSAHLHCAKPTATPW